MLATANGPMGPIEGVRTSGQRHCGRTNRLQHARLPDCRYAARMLLTGPAAPRLSADVTTGDDLEIHHVANEKDPSSTGFARVVETTIGLCGSLCNVTGCPHAGDYAGQVLPLEPFARLLQERIVAKGHATGILPRMHVGLACSSNCGNHAEASDIGFVATPGQAGELPTFTVWGTGGLGAVPRPAFELRGGLVKADFVPAFDALVALGAKFDDRTSAPQRAISSTRSWTPRGRVAGTRRCRSRARSSSARPNRTFDRVGQSLGP